MQSRQSRYTVQPLEELVFLFFLPAFPEAGHPDKNQLQYLSSLYVKNKIQS